MKLCGGDDVTGIIPKFEAGEVRAKVVPLSEQEIPARQSAAC